MTNSAKSTLFQEAQAADPQTTGQVMQFTVAGTCKANRGLLEPFPEKGRRYFPK